MGPSFIGVHEMLDPQYDGASLMVDAAAERIATLGGQPLGTPGAIVGGRTGEDYRLNRAVTDDHLQALDHVHVGVIEDHRKAIALVGDIDPVSEDLLIGQTNDLELYHWFVRAHLEDKGGQLQS